MDNNEKWLQWAVELQNLAQAAIFYGKDVFDKERYERIREIAAEMISYKTDISMDKVKNLFCNEIGYQTPKIDCRAAVFQNNKILLVQGRYSTLHLQETESLKSVSTSINSISYALPLMRRSRGRQAMRDTLRITRKTAISGARTV